MAMTADLTQSEASSKTTTVANLCRLNDLPVGSVERALAGLQAKGLVTGFVPGDINAKIDLTPKAALYSDTLDPL